MMTSSGDFHALLSSLLQQAAEEPDALPDVTFDCLPLESQERRLLEELRAVLGTRQNRDSTPIFPPDEKGSRFSRISEAARDGLIIHDLETGRVVEANPAACAMYGWSNQTFINLAFHNFVHPDSSVEYAKYIQAVKSEGVTVAQQIHIRQDGSPFHVEMSGSILTDQGHSYLLSIVRDVSQRVHSEQRLNQRVKTHTREQAILLEISQTLASALELQPGLILDQLRVIIEYTHAGLFKREDSTLVTLAVRGPQALEQAMPFQIRLQSPETLTLLLNERSSTRIADVQSSDPPAQFLRALLTDQANILIEGVQSWMWVPLAIKGRIIGAIGVAHTEPNFFTAHHAGLALTVANQAAITMVNAELYENAQTLAALQERQRLARDLHDAVNQSLFSAGLIAEVLPRLWDQNPEEGRRSLEDLRRLTRGAQADMRLLLAELLPSNLTDAKLGDLLHLLGNALAGRTNIPVVVAVDGEGKLPAEVQVSLYRLCQESLNNIAKHSGASRVEIKLQFTTGVVELHIRDNGRGFEPESAQPGHYGLRMMYERAAAINAALAITSQPGHGAEIIIRWVDTLKQKGGAK